MKIVLIFFNGAIFPLITLKVFLLFLRLISQTLKSLKRAYSWIKISNSKTCKITILGLILLFPFTHPRKPLIMKVAVLIFNTYYKGY